MLPEEPLPLPADEPEPELEPLEVLAVPDPAVADSLDAPEKPVVSLVLPVEQAPASRAPKSTRGVRVTGS